jgi:hypothetical protein
MLGVCFFDFVLGDLSGDSLNQLHSIAVVDEQVHASLFVVEGD